MAFLKSSAFLISSAAILGGCDPTVFDSIGDEAPVIAIEAPGSYPKSGFGAKVVAFEGQIAGEHVSRIAVNAGAGSPTRVFRAWGATSGLHPDDAVFEDCKSNCGPNAGTAITGFPRWNYTDAVADNDRDVCLLETSPSAGGSDTGQVRVRCETDTTVDKPTGFDNTQTSRFGIAAIGLADGSPFGVALVGAPGVNRISRLPDARAFAPLDLGTDPGQAGAGVVGLGAAFASGVLVDGTTVVAVGAPEADDMDTKRTIIFTSLGDAVDQVDVRACLDSDAPGFGSSLAIGDIDNDGAPEIFVASSPDSTGRNELIYVWRGASIPTPTTGGADPLLCRGWGAAPVEIACPTEASTDVSCTGAGFGGAMTIADVNGDGFGDLIAGAPQARVKGKNSAGAVFVIPGSASGLDVTHAKVLHHSTPDVGNELGRSVAAFRADGRSEIVAGAPGSDEALVFLCSGLEGDEPSIGKRCQP